MYELECPYFKRVIECGECIDYNMIIFKWMKNDLGLSDEEIHRMREVCGECIHRMPKNIEELMKTWKRVL